MIPNWDRIQALLGCSNDGGNLTTFSDIASEILAELRADCEITDERAELIHALLTAHFYTISNPELASKSIAGASESWRHGQLGEGLKATSFGGQLLLLDKCQFFQSLGQHKPNLWYLGG